jgi:hypothetical protein
MNGDRPSLPRHIERDGAPDTTRGAGDQNRFGAGGMRKHVENSQKPTPTAWRIRHIRAFALHGTSPATKFQCKCMPKDRADE